MEHFEYSCDDLKYLASEMQDVLIRNRKDIPENFYKVMIDLIYHTKNTVKEMEKEYEQFIETWDDSDS
jgi:hypothetical protein